MFSTLSPRHNIQLQSARARKWVTHGAKVGRFTGVRRVWAGRFGSYFGSRHAIDKSESLRVPFGVSVCFTLGTSF